MQDVNYAVSLPSFYCLYDNPLLLDSVQYLFSHTSSPADLLYSSPAPHFKTFQVLIYFPKCPIFSTTQSYTISQALYRTLIVSSLNFSPIF